VAGIGTFEFSVASYNILDPDLLEEHSYIYGHCDERNLRWSYRRQNIMRQLNCNNPDVCVNKVLNFYCTDCQQSINVDCVLVVNVHCVQIKHTHHIQHVSRPMCKVNEQCPILTAT